MLTSDLLVARNIKGKIHPSYLKEKDKTKYLTVIESIINIFKTHIGLSLGELDESLKASCDTSINKKIIDGFIKLLKDRCEFTVESDISPETIRRELFLESFKQWKNLSVKDTYNRSSVLKSISNKLGITENEIEEMMYADLRGSQIIKDFKSILAISLFNRYNLSLAQAVLFKATKVNISIKKASSKQYRELFRYIKFFRLIYTVKGNQNDGYEIILDGPFSLFKSVQKYGFQMALFLPALLLVDEWEVKADLLWGKLRQDSTFELNNKTNLISHYNNKSLGVLEECDVFLKQFKELKNDWEINTTSEIINLKGEGICIPDFIFKNEKTGKKVFMEVFGYWSRDSVWKRIELLEKNFPYKLILVVSKKLRISEKAVKDNMPGQVYVYSSVILPKSILKILDGWEEDSQQTLFD